MFEKLPSNVQRIIEGAKEEDRGRPARKLLKETFDAERECLEELLLGFAENQESVLRGRFLPDDMEKYIWQDKKGDLTLRYGDGEAKVVAKCWEYFFIFREKRDLPADRVKAIQEVMGDVFQFVFKDTSVSPMQMDDVIDFELDFGVHYMRVSLEVGAWCEMRFEAGSAFTDGRVLVVTLKPRVLRSKDIPAKPPMSPSDFVKLLNARRGR
ncbi:hypothetical protein ACFL59_09410 [Planctomycetota bacterium]